MRSTALRPSRSFRRVRSSGRRPATTARSTTKPTPSRGRPRKKSLQLKAKAPNRFLKPKKPPAWAAFVVSVEKTENKVEKTGKFSVVKNAPQPTTFHHTFHHELTTKT